LNEIPIEISKMKKLTELFLEGNPIFEISKEFFKIKKLDRKMNFTNQINFTEKLDENYCLHLEDQNIEQIILKFEKSDSIKSLNLSKNQLRSVSSDIGDFSSLIELNLSKNSIRNFPPEIGKLFELTRLDISDNKISVIPKGVFDELNNLETLKLKGNVN
jgi:leucine-rich repeat protein SHOC2